MPTYSISRISTYENCPCKYRMQYIEKVKVPKFDSIEAFLGNRVHETLQKLYDDLALSKMNSLNDLLEYYGSVWKELWHDNIVINRKGFTAANYYDTGTDALTSYCSRYYPFNRRGLNISTESEERGLQPYPDSGKVITLATEKQIFFNIGSYRMRGVIDRLDQVEDGIYEIHDYKTAGRCPDIQYLGKDRQLPLYQIGLRQYYPDAERVKLIWHYLIYNKEFVVEKSDEDLAEIEAEMIRAIESVEAAARFDPVESMLCNWCEYYPVCPAKKHLIKTESLPEEEFLQEDGVDLVNKYAERYLEIRRLKAELEELRKRAIEVAHREGYTSIKGSTHFLDIREKDVMKFPLRGEPDRDKLEEIITEAGKWEALASLSIPSLQKAVSGTELDSNLREKILRYSEEIKETAVWLKKLASF